MAPVVSSTRATHPCDHLIQAYTDDAFLARVVADYVGAALGRGDGAVVIAAPEHSQAVTARLERAARSTSPRPSRRGSCWS